MAVLAAILDAVLFDEPAAAEATSEGAEAQAVVSGTDVFVVHGHDEATKARVARLLERLGLRPVVLHEQPNRGMTIIEKFEKHAGAAGFAVILLTADDVGCGESEGKTRPRARQNVVLELGYFIGKLGRSRVAVLHAPSVELPSDILGVAYTSLSSSWEFALAKELRAAGYAIDLNKLA